MVQSPLFINWLTGQPVPITPSTLTPGVRAPATGTVTIYVDQTNGSDSNNGFTPATAFKTLQAAYANAVVNWDFRGFGCVIQGAAGQTYTSGLAINNNLVGASSFVIDMAGSTISTTSADCIAAATFPTIIGVSNVTLTTTTGGNCIASYGNAAIDVNPGVVFGACANTHMIASEPGAIVQVNTNANPSITGGASAHVVGQYGGLMLYGNSTVTITGTPNFTGAFAFVTSCGLIYAGNGALTFTGAATGNRYTSQSNSVIQTNGGGANFFPGSVAGTTSTGGLYL